jgi:hypothetical protein
VQIALDALFAIFWIVAAALSTYDCDGVCSSCSAGGALVDTQGQGFDVYFGDLYCSCVFPGDLGSGYSSSKLFRRASRTGAGVNKVGKQALSIAAKKGLDAALM